VFYPLWPLLVRYASPLAGGSHLLTALVLANLFSLFAWLLFFRFVLERWGTTVARWSLVFLLAFPGSLFFQFNYTENLFFLLVILLWRLLEEGRYHWACLPAALLPLTRAVGIIAVLPIACYVLHPLVCFCSSRREEALIHSAIRNPQSAIPKYVLKETAARLHLLLWPLVGFGAYLLLMWHWTGNAFEGFSAHHFYNAHSVGNLINLPKFIEGFLTPGHWHEFTGSVLDRALFVLLICTLPLIWRLDKKLIVWAYMLGVLPAMSGTFQAYTRYVSCAFPMFIALGVFFAPPQRRWGRYLLLFSFAILQVLLVWRYVNFRWAG
jgi:hypothetical protein